ncbi:hypothetical protein D7036_20855 [Aquimarina sp. BL5]|uniref:hypothetical protein n=1 Tax=Aquimarina sp. BL5 TaxID=1714860 RepID=UPI000EAA52AB|nr:hypothetical protein [Aquimarina sp. BL5]RKM96802.1 hypothetical protein D7036_20855 [Aquimarina sp. BL5]
MAFNISLNYQDEKLKNPSIMDKIDVFEDQILYSLFYPAEMLAKQIDQYSYSNSILMHVLNYFEMIAQYLKGKNSDGQSRVFFNYGLKAIIPGLFDHAEQLMAEFDPESPIPPRYSPESNAYVMQKEFAEENYKLVTKGFYKLGRCGVFHSSFPKKGFSITNNPSILMTSGEISGNEMGIVLNPWAMLQHIKAHFLEYIKSLRREEKPNIENFEIRFDMEWNHIYEN